MRGNELKRTLYQNLLENSQLSVSATNIFEGLDGLETTFNVDEKRAARRWFTGVLNVMIYQVEGNSGDILPQQYKLTLKDLKSKVSVHIPLHGKVRRASAALN